MAEALVIKVVARRPEANEGGREEEEKGFGIASPERGDLATEILPVF